MRLPKLSNCYCLPSRAGGSPIELDPGTPRLVVHGVRGIREEWSFPQDPSSQGLATRNAMVVASSPGSEGRARPWGVWHNPWGPAEIKGERLTVSQAQVA